MNLHRKVYLVIAILGSAFTAASQVANVTISGIISDKANQEPMPYVNVVLKSVADSAFVAGTVTNEEGLFTLDKIIPGNYYVAITYPGYKKVQLPVYVGNLTDYLNLPRVELETISSELDEVVVTVQQEAVDEKMDKKSYKVEDNVAQSGGSVLQVMQNLPGITVQDGKVLLRGSDQIIVLIDGKQTAMTGFGNQYGLDNIPASAIERIEIINNPSSKYDANGNAGIINIIMKKNRSEGFNGKVGLTGGAGVFMD